MRNRGTQKSPPDRPPPGLASVHRGRFDRGRGKFNRPSGQTFLYVGLALATVMVGYWFFAGRALDKAKGQLLAKQRGADAQLGPKWYPLREKIEKTTLAAAAGPYAGDAVDPEMASWDFRSQPGIYLRLRVADARDAESLRKAAAESARDSFTGCLLRLNGAVADRADAGAGAGTASAAAASDNQPWNLRQAYAATRVLTPEWSSEVRAAGDDLRLRVFEQQYEKAVRDEIPVAADVVTRARYFLLVLDEDVEEAKAFADGGAVTEEALQRTAHPARVHVVNLRTGREMARLRRSGEASFVFTGEKQVTDEATLEAMQRQVNNCDPRQAGPDGALRRQVGLPGVRTLRHDARHHAARLTFGLAAALASGCRSTPATPIVDFGHTCAAGEASCAAGCGDACLRCPSGATACRGVCADTDSDPENCGRCGADCSGATCLGGVCQPIVLASTIGLVRALDTYEGDVYALVDASRLEPAVLLGRVPLRGPACLDGDPTCFRSLALVGRDRPFALRTAPSGLYLGLTTSILRHALPLDDALPALVDDGGTILPFAAASADVCWINDNAVHCSDGTAPRGIIGNEGRPSLLGVALNERDVFARETGVKGLLRGARDGTCTVGTCDRVAEDATVTTFAVTSRALFWLQDHDAFSSDLMRADRETCPRATKDCAVAIAREVNQVINRGTIVADDTDVYWIEETAVRRARIGQTCVNRECATIPLAGTDVTNIALTPDFLIVARQYGLSVSATSTITRFPR